MSFAEKNRIFLEKLRNLSDKKKKIILWAIVVVMGLGMGYFWVNGAINSVSKIGESIKTIKLPAIDMPNIPAMPSLDISQTTTPSNENPIVGKSTDETADWQAYTSNKYGFEIEYPIGWDNKIGNQGEMGAYSLLSLDINKNSSDFNINHASYVRLVIEDDNYTIGTRDWKNFELGQINGEIASSATGYEIIFKSSQGQNFYIVTKNNPEKDNITNQILSTFKFIQ